MPGGERVRWGAADGGDVGAVERRDHFDGEPRVARKNGGRRVRDGVVGVDDLDVQTLHDLGKGVGGVKGGVAPAVEERKAEPVPPVTTGANTSALQKIVVRFADGQLLKGFTQDFHPTRPQFSLWPAVNSTPSERVVVPLHKLKAVFFVKDFDGNPSYRERKSFIKKGQGRRVEVTFLDSETILGTTLNYRPDGLGFFVHPADSGTNNSRIFAINKAVRRVQFL